MATNDEVSFRVTADVGQANKALSDMHSLGRALKDPLDKFDAGMRESQKVLRGLQGQMSGMKSPALDMLGVFADLGGSFASGGAFNLGMTAGAFVIGKVSEAIIESRENARIFVDSVSTMNSAVINMTRASIQPSRDAIRALAQELVNFGRDARQIAIESAQFNVSSLEGRSGNLQLSLGRETNQLTKMREDFNRRALAGMSREDRIDGAKELLIQQAIVSSIKGRADATLKTLEEERGNLDKITRMALELDAKEADRDRANKAKADAEKAAAKGAESESLLVSDFAPSNGAFSFSMIPEDPRETARRQARDKLMEDSQRADDMRRDRELQADEDLLAAEMDALDRYYEFKDHKMAEDLQKQQAIHAQIEQSFNDVFKDAAGAAFNSAIGAAESYFIAVATGEKHAAEKSAAMFLSSTGQQLVGIGAKAIWEGAIISANPASLGAGLPMMGIGAAAVAAGIAMGAGGASISAGIPSAGRGRGGSGGGMDRGVNSPRRESGGSRDATPAPINIVYGAAGPAPEDTGREVERVLNVRRRRLGMA